MPCWLHFCSIFGQYFNDFGRISNDFNKIFGRKPRKPDKDALEQFHMDIAASIQHVTEEVIIKICQSIQKEYSIENL